MNNLDNLKTIWHSAKTDDLPTSDEMIKMIQAFKSEKLRKKWVVIVGASFLSCLMIALLCTTAFKLVSTYIGGGMIAATYMMAVVMEIRSLKRFRQLDNCNNIQFLSFVEQTRLNQLYYYKKTQGVIMLFCAVGFLLFFYESGIGNPALLVGMYAGFAVYMLIIWFFVRPRYFKKNLKKLNETTERLTHISNQLK